MAAKQMSKQNLENCYYDVAALADVSTKAEIDFPRPNELHYCFLLVTFSNLLGSHFLCFRIFYLRILVFLFLLSAFHSHNKRFTLVQYTHIFAHSRRKLNELELQRFAITFCVVFSVHHAFKRIIWWHTKNTETRSNVTTAAHPTFILCQMAAIGMKSQQLDTKRAFHDRRH